MTDKDGLVVDERLYTPFGQPISANHNVEPHGWVNKPHDTTTGYSDHGARWYVPSMSRWLTPDPPVKAPDPQFMAAPWKLHPYQYVDQNPVLFWDPDGRAVSDSALNMRAEHPVQEMAGTKPPEG